MWLLCLGENDNADSPDNFKERRKLPAALHTVHILMETVDAILSSFFSASVYLAFLIYKGYSMKENINNFLKISKTKKWQGIIHRANLSCVDIFRNG